MESEWLGKEVRDIVTGLHGIVTAQTIHLNGCQSSRQQASHRGRVGRRSASRRGWSGGPGKAETSSGSRGASGGRPPEGCPEVLMTIRNST